MTEKIKKSQEIIQRLNKTKENIGVLSELINIALVKLQEFTDEELYMRTSIVKEKWMPKEEAAKLLEAQALLVECQKELDDIDDVTKTVDESVAPITDKLNKWKEEHKQ
jgi:hypothetical protein